MEILLDPNLWIAYAMLNALEIVLGVDNVIFISILVGRLPAQQRDMARRLGLGFAMVSRLLLLFSMSWVMGLTDNLFNVLGQGISGRDLVLLLGGLFLLYKASHEIFVEVEAPDQHGPPATDVAAMRAASKGMALTAEAFDVAMPKGYIYAAMAFSLAVEALNIRARAKRGAAAAAASNRG